MVKWVMSLQFYIAVVRPLLAKDRVCYDTGGRNGLRACRKRRVAAARNFIHSHGTVAIAERDLQIEVTLFA
jgi:hypothetical protein